MPVKKFKTFDDAAKDLWVYNPDDQYYQNLKAIFEFWSKITQRKIKKGIQKFTTISEANKEKLKYE